MQTTDFALCVYLTLQGTVDLCRPPSHLLYIEPVLYIVLESYFTLQCGPPALPQHFTELPFCAALHWICPLLCSVDLCKCRFVHFHLYFACCTAFILFFILHSTDLKLWEDLQVASSKTGGGGFTIGIGGV